MMAVSKRTRYEVLRRDNHTCRYCGAAAPDAKLTLDHVLPVALGGTDDPTNLVAACRDCNAGKTSTTPDAALVAQVVDDAERWAQARKQAAARIARDGRAAKRLHDQFVALWKCWDKDCSNLPGDFRGSIDYWIKAGLSMAAIEEALDIAVGAPSVGNHYVFKYMAGVLKNKLRDLDKATEATVRESAPAQVEATPFTVKGLRMDRMIEYLDLVVTARHPGQRIGAWSVLDNLAGVA